MGMSYYEFRRAISKIIPGQTILHGAGMVKQGVKEKGRKKNYHQFNLEEGEFKKQERLLNTEEVSSFLEISIRASACPMPFNLDIYDGLLCPFGCKYCFADAFRSTLYTAFFDNSKTMGIRNCNPTFYKQELDKLMKLRGDDPHKYTDIKKAMAMNMPVRFGVRFEDFTRIEEHKGVSLELMRYLKDNAYPLMINTKSSLIGTDPYVKALSENKGGAAVHITMISSDEIFNKRMEPGAPSFDERIKAAKNLSDAGVRVVARIEPFMMLINDDEEMVMEYIEKMKWAGIKNITFDTYSYSANSPSIRESFNKQKWDFHRMFLLMADSQGVGSLVLQEFMKFLQSYGFSCSTFDAGNMVTNDQDVCCEVGDTFDGCGFNYGSIVYAARYIIEQEGKPVTWNQYEAWVNEKGGFLSPSLRRQVHELWNCGGNTAYSLEWADGLSAVGQNETGIIWKYHPEKTEDDPISGSFRDKIVAPLIDIKTSQEEETPRR